MSQEFKNIFKEEMEETENIEEFSLTEKASEDKIDEFLDFDDYSIVKILKKDFYKYALLSPLLEIKDTPKQLFIKYKSKENLDNFLNKNFDGEDYKVLTIVGSRKNTNYGKEVLSYLLKYLTGEKVIIVSGLALGVDSLAHKFSLKNDLPTISIPGSGLSKKVLYPSQNISLAEDLLKAENIFISEYEIDRKSEIYFFPARNRVMAAISDAVLIVEAGEKSGTLITAKLALDYNKDVGVIPNNIFAEGSVGSNKLIKEGATPILNITDLLDFLNINKDVQGVLALNFNNEEEKNKFKNILDTLSEYEKNILQKVLQAGSIEKDILLENLEEEYNMSYTDSLVALMSLEINGFIKEKEGEIGIVR